MKNKNIRKIIELLRSNGITLFEKNGELKVKKRTENQLSDEILNLLKSNKNELIAFLKKSISNSTNRLKTASDYGLPSTVTNKKLNDFLNLPELKGKIVEVSPLTPLQKGFLFHNLYEENTSAYVCQFYYDIKGVLSKDLFRKSWSFLMQTHTALRTAIFSKELDIPVQCVFDQVDLPLRELDYSSFSKEESEKTFDTFLKSDKEIGFHLEEAPLFRITLIDLGENRTRLVFTNHHIMLDGWSFQVLMRSFKAYYLRLKSGIPLPSMELDDYGVHLRDISSRNTAEGLTYWKKYLSELKSPTYLPFIKDVTKRNKVFGNKTQEFSVFGNIQDFTKKYRITENTFIQGVWSLLLSKYTSNKTVVFGATISGRDSDKEAIEENVGLYINAVPVCSTIDEDSKVVDWLQGLQEEQAIGREEYGYLALSDLESQSIVKKSLFDSFITFINYPEEAPASLEKEELILENFKAIEGTNYTVSLVALSSPQGMDILLRYNTEVISEKDITHIKGHLETLIESILSGTEVIKDLSYLSKNEEVQLVNVFNNTETKYAENNSLIDLFSAEVASHPERTALVYKNKKLTYAELDQRSNQVAHYLLSEGVIPGNIVGLLFDRSPEMIIGIFGVLKTGAGYLPLDSGLPEKRIRYMLNQSSATFLLSEEQYLEQYLAYLPAQKLNTPNILGQAISKVNVDTFATDLAYCIFTSGSTGNPKGVLMNQSSVINLVKGLEKRVYNTYKDSPLRVALLASYAFDASVQQIFGALLQGHSLYITDDETRKDGEKLLTFYNENNIDVSDGTPTHLRFLVEALTEKSKLHHLTSWILAGEVLPKDIVNTFYKKLGIGTQLYNFYGPTETCVDSTSFKVDPEKLNTYRTIPIGSPLPNERVYVVDNRGDLVPMGVIGELCIAGNGLALRYTGDSVLTSEKFSTEWIASEDRVYRTGDMVCWLPDGNLEYHGRRDDQVKIRGYRIELAEIEEQLNAHPAIEHTIVVSKKSENEIDLIAYYKGLEKLNTGNLRAHLATLLPDYMIPHYYMYMEDFPYMNNGKVDRKSLPELHIDQEDNYKAPVSKIEKKLVTIYAEILNIEEQIIGVNNSFIDLGGHSLKMVFLANYLTKEFGVKVSLKEIISNSTICKLSRLISKSGSVDHSQIPVAEISDYYPLSSSQKRMYFAYEFDRTSIAYNVAIAATLKGVLDKEKFEDSFIKLIQRHDSLRTVFEFVEEELVQRILPKVNFSISHLKKGKNINDTIRNFIKPFDLKQAPLLRVGLIEVSEKEHIVLVDCHHIISDEVTNNIVLKDFASLYSGQNLPELRIQYKDYVLWQLGEKEQKEIELHKAYWLRKFSGEIPVLDLPYDYLRPQKSSVEGGNFSVELTKNQVVKLKALALSNGVTMYTICLSLYNVLLYKLSGQNDIVVGTPSVGRSHIDLQEVAGIFINTLPIRNELNTALSFNEFVQQVQKNNSLDLDHQRYPYENLVDAVKVERDVRRNALFDVFLNYYTEKDRLTSIDSDIKIDLLEDKLPQAKFDLTLTVLDSDDKLKMNFTFKKELFKQETIARFGSYLERIVNQIIENKPILLRDIEILSDAEIDEQLIQFNETNVEFDREKSLLDLFAEQVQMNPNKVALVFEDKELTYLELNEKSTQLARYINIQDKTNSSLAGLCVDRSLEMIVGILGILKSGRGYVPIEASNPVNRINNIIEDSGISVMVTQKKMAPLFSEINPILLDKDSKSISEQSPADFPYTVNPDDLAYVIYTSGSTGKPKGVMVSQKSVVKLVQDKGAIAIQSTDRVLQWSNVAFDGSVYDIFCSLLNGATLYLINKKITSDATSLSAFIAQNDITVSFMTTALFNIFITTEITGLLPLRKLLFGGERVSLKNVQIAYDVLGPDTMIHCYGPTETTVYATYYSINERPKHGVPIGGPLTNTTVYVLNTFNKLCGLGVVGELFIGGEGLALGYLNDTEKTSDKFIDHPYKNGACLYKTGDLVKWLPDGNLEFVGRRDNQVKLRGFRIELKEIETVLESHPSVKQAYVIVQGVNENKQLHAYLKGKGAYDTTELLENLTVILPSYMIPSNIIWLDEFPYTTNGKIDHKTLIKNEVKTTNTYVAPANEIEIKLVKLWSKILDIEESKISITSSFMSLGGHSLNAMQMVNMFRKDSGIQLKLYEIFKGKTIRQISESIAMESWLENGNEQELKREEILL